MERSREDGASKWQRTQSIMGSFEVIAAFESIGIIDGPKSPSLGMPDEKKPRSGSSMSLTSIGRGTSRNRFVPIGTLALPRNPENQSGNGSQMSRDVILHGDGHGGERIEPTKEKQPGLPAFNPPKKCWNCVSVHHLVKDCPEAVRTTPYREQRNARRAMGTEMFRRLEREEKQNRTADRKTEDARLSENRAADDVRRAELRQDIIDRRVREDRDTAERRAVEDSRFHKQAADLVEQRTHQDRVIADKRLAEDRQDCVKETERLRGFRNFS